MAKPTPKENQHQKKQQPFCSLSAAPSLSPISSFLHQSVFMVLIGFTIYFNSFSNKYALDDDIVMRLNDYVQEGFAGIGKIMTTDSYDSFFKSMGSSGELSGGRYRPLSIFTFAVEQQLFGETSRHPHAAGSGFYFQYADDDDESQSAEQADRGKGPIGRTDIASHESLAQIRHIVSVVLYILSVVLLLKLLRDYIFKYANIKYVNDKTWRFSLR